MVDMSFVYMKLFCFNGPFFHSNPSIFLLSFTLATRDGDVSQVVNMMESGTLVHIVDEYGNTNLMKAAMHNRTDIVCYLLKKGANVNKQDCIGWTALLEASFTNHTGVIKILVQHRARTVIKTDGGNTPIDVARRQNHEEAVGLLQQH